MDALKNRRATAEASSPISACRRYQFEGERTRLWKEQLADEERTAVPMDHVFSIIMLPETIRGPSGERLGEMRVDGFTERFPLHPAGDDLYEQVADWKRQLTLLAEGATAVALRTDPRFAWVLYRSGDDVCVQQHMMDAGWPGEVDSAGRITKLPPRVAVTEDGEEVSQWQTTLAAVREFVAGP